MRSRTDSGRVALKVLRWVGTSPERRRRFEREAQALGRLEHSGIARLLGSGVLDAPEGPLPYLAMEYVAGPGLRAVMERGRGDVSRVMGFMAEIAGILDVAHGRGVVHRDLKPENIVVDTHGRARVLDFGVARLEEGGLTGATLATRVGQIIGTLQYMSPEQAASDGRPVDGREAEQLALSGGVRQSGRGNGQVLWLALNADKVEAFQQSSLAGTA